MNIYGFFFRAGQKMRVDNPAHILLQRTNANEGGAVGDFINFNFLLVINIRVCFVFIIVF